MKFNFGWWNTHLSPPSTRDAPVADHIEAASTVLAALIGHRELDLICLGEVSPSSCEELSARLRERSVEVQVLEGREGGTAFNMAVAFRPDRVRLAAPVFEFDVIAGRKSKIAVRLLVQLHDGSVVTLFVVHWTSRLYADVETEKRSHLAQTLRQKIDKLLDEDENAKIIVLGDFNDEPFDLSLSRYLLASRDVHRVSANPRLLYNPFWRSLVPVGHYSVAGLPDKVSGSYYYRSGLVHRWHTFDQIVFSSAFLGKGAWHLNEEGTSIVKELVDLISNLEDGGHFDHYPVLAALERQEDESV